MLENIIGQKKTCEILKQELQAGRFPQAILFHGPRFSAKMSAALEVARILSCEDASAPWSCPCPSCRRQRLLTYPHTLLLGPRYFDLEIASCADVLRRSRKRSAQYLYLRAVRKLTRRFDPLIWEGDEAKLGGLRPSLAEIEEQLDSLSPEEELPEDRSLEKRLDSIASVSRKLTELVSTETIPIHHLRQVASWLRLSDGGRRKVVILENADRMYEASSASLLKLLEEPPASATLILTTTRRSSIAPTLLSRLRTYSFADRGEEETREVLARVFQEERSQCASLRDYFLNWRELDREQVRGLARKYAAGLLAREASPGEDAELMEELSSLFGPKSGKGAAGAFFEELSLHFQSLLRQGTVGASRLRRWNRLLHEHYGALERFNQNPSLVLESLTLHLRTVR